MKYLILAVVFLILGCAQVSTLPTKTAVPEPVKIVPEGCVQSKLDPSYTYQSVIDPKTIFDEWEEIIELRKGSFMAMELMFKNPGIDAPILAAMFLVQGGAFTALVYLIAGESKLFFYDGDSECYEKNDLDEEQQKYFKARLLQALGGEGV